jgi:protein-disulfide isomerase
MNRRRLLARLAGLVAALALVAGCTATVDGHPSIAGGTGAPVGSSASGGPSSGAGSASAPAAVPDLTGGVHVGSGSVHVEAWDDLACPPCAQLEKTFAPVIADELTQGDVAFTFHDVSFLDSQSLGAHYSSRAADAALCAAQVGPTQYLQAKQELLAHQAPEGQVGPTDGELVEQLSAAGVSSADVTACVTGDRFAAQVVRVTQAAESGGVTSVPRVAVNGTVLTSPTGASIRAAIDAAR